MAGGFEVHPVFGCWPHRDFPFHLYEMVIFLSVVAIKICNKHNWDVCSISLVSSCQVGLYDTDFCSDKASLIREIKH